MQKERIPDFTKRELEVLRLVVEGLSTKLIADRLGISHGTAELHRNHLIKKSNSHNMIVVVVKAIKNEWI